MLSTSAAVVYSNVQKEIRAERYSLEAGVPDVNVHALKNMKNKRNTHNRISILLPRPQATSEHLCGCDITIRRWAPTKVTTSRKSGSYFMSDYRDNVVVMLYQK